MTYKPTGKLVLVHINRRNTTLILDADTESIYDWSGEVKGVGPEARGVKVGDTVLCPPAFFGHPLLPEDHALFKDDAILAVAVDE